MPLWSHMQAWHAFVLNETLVRTNKSCLYFVNKIPLFIINNLSRVIYSLLLVRVSLSKVCLIFDTVFFTCFRHVHKHANDFNNLNINIFVNFQAKYHCNM